MGQANCRPRIALDLSAHEFKLLIRCLAGTLHEDEEFKQAQDLGVHLLDQYVRNEKERVKQLAGVLGRLRSVVEPKEGSEDPEREETVPVTVLRPGSEPLGRYSHR
jgi:hypothetical protein